MPTFLCFLNWTDQGAKNTKDIVKRYQASKAVVEKLGGRMLSAYVTTGQYDVVVTVETPTGETMGEVCQGNCRYWECEDHDRTWLFTGGVFKALGWRHSGM